MESFYTINIEDERWKGRVLSKKATDKILKIIFQEINIKTSNVFLDIIFTDEIRMKKINLKFRNKNGSTNVISLENSIKMRDLLIGEMFFSFDDIEQEAIEQKKLFKNHLIHLFIHSMLHILGHDHIQEKEAEIMENIEINVLEKLKIDNPY